MNWFESLTESVAPWPAADSDKSHGRDDEEVHDSANSIANMQSMIAALMLTFTYAVDGGGIDLSAIGVCDEGCKSVLPTLESARIVCHNVHGFCGESLRVRRWYRLVTIASTGCLCVSLCLAHGVIVNFSKIPKRRANVYKRLVPHTIHFPDYFLKVGVFFFIIAVLIQCSLTMLSSDFQVVLLFACFCLLAISTFRYRLRRARRRFHEIEQRRNHEKNNGNCDDKKKRKNN